MKQRVSNREITAYHEAGHVVVAVSLGVPFSSVTIKPGKRYLGLTYSKVIGRTWECPLAELDQNQLMCVMAGSLSEQIFTGLCLFSDPVARKLMDAIVSLPWSDEPDECQGSRLGIDIPMKYVERTEKLLRSNWPKVERIAKALLEQQTLSRQKVTKLLEDL
jgi:ATP-dependent Zn protease